MNLEKAKEALKLAGKTAIASQMVCRASAFNISSRVAELQKAVEEYDNYIIEWSAEEN